MKVPIPNRNNLPMREYWKYIIIHFGGFYKEDRWYIPSVPGLTNVEYYSKSIDLYTAYVLTMDAVKMKVQNQG